ncbi:hypothetical protein [Helicobacter sp. T3_23-1056]
MPNIYLLKSHTNVQNPRKSASHIKSILQIHFINPLHKSKLQNLSHKIYLAKSHFANPPPHKITIPQNPHINTLFFFL